jgi:hypothetical protein
MRTSPKYTRERVRGYWWNIKKGTKIVGYISIGSDHNSLKYQFYAVNLDPVTLVGYGYRTVQDAFNAYVEKFPLK